MTLLAMLFLLASPPKAKLCRKFGTDELGPCAKGQPIRPKRLRAASRIVGHRIHHKVPLQ